MSKRADVCAGSYAHIPDGGAVHCACGRVWSGRTRDGTLLFTVPLHDADGHVQRPEKIAERIDVAFAARKYRKAC